MPTLQKIRIYYDPLGRVVRTQNPDHSEQRVVYGVPKALNTPGDYNPSPWESYTYDANDLAPIANNGSNPVPNTHWYTPKSAEVDALGRTIKTNEHQVFDNGSTYEDVVMQYKYDVRGNLLSVIDPLNRTVFTHVYDLRSPQKGEDGKQQPLPPLKTTHIDKGTSTVLFDATGKPIQSNDAKGAMVLSSYDVMSRPVNAWAKNKGTDALTLRGISTYGDTAGTGATDNMNGKPYETYDEAGKVTLSSYDFKGNLLSKTREVLDDSVLQGALSSYTNYVMDWDSSPTLSSMDFTSDMQYDALNRVTEMQLPTDLDAERKKIIPSYNRAGALEKVDLYSPAGPTTTNFVENIAYNAKGQRLMIAFGNGVMTRYTYHPQTFRLQRQRSEGYSKSTSGATLTYAYTSSSKRQDDGFNYDFVGNILQIFDRMKDCGLSGTPHQLDRTFTYDPLNRLTFADGRESNTQNQNLYLYDEVPTPGGWTNVRAYSRTYTYDKLGNIQSLVQGGSNGFTRNFTYNSGLNTLQKIEDSSSVLLESYTYDANGNQITSNLNRKYEWNHADQLICYKNQVGSGTPTVYAQYDYSGQSRVSKIVRTGINYERTIYIDGIFEYVWYDNGTLYEKNYIHIMDDKSRIAEVRIDGGTGAFPGDITETKVYILENQIGSAVMRVDNSGTEIDREEYYPFGDSSLRTFTYKRYRYVGKERDAESGLYYYGARHYSAWTCRFISVDSLADRYAHISPYNYADNNPINDFDIDGNQDKNTGETPKSDSSNSGSKSAAPADNTATKNIKVDQAAINAVNNKQKSANGEAKQGLDSKGSNITVKPGGQNAASKTNTTKAAQNGTTTSNSKKTETKTTEKPVVEPKEMPEGGKLSSTPEERIEKAREYEGKYKYSLTVRSDSTLNCADFVAKVMVQTDYEVAKTFLTHDYYSYVPTMLSAIKERGDTLRMTNPKVGDLAFWHNSSNQKGHVEFVATSDGTNFTTFGARKGTVPNEMGKSGNGFTWLNTNYSGIGALGAGGVFVGFWTPPSKR